MQKRISQINQEELVELSFPAAQAGAFYSQFTLVAADGHLHLPTSSISQNNPPDTIGIVDRFIGQ